MVMGSGGALMTARTARARPVDLVESGPAAGVSAAVRVAQAIGIKDAISFDMGGTTAKVGLILDGEARTLSEFEVGAGAGLGDGRSRRRAGTRSSARSSTWSRSAPAAAASPGSTPAVCRASGRGAPGPTRARPATAAAARSPP